MDASKTLETEFFIPLNHAFNSECIKKRKSGTISDWEHLQLGVKRCMTHFESGRCFVQKITDTVADSKISVANYFNCQRSGRRLEQVKNVNKVLVKNYTSPIDDNPFAGLTCLDGYAIYAADGHYQKAAAHDRHSNGKNYPVGHVFTVNLRNQTEE